MLKEHTSTPAPIQNAGAYSKKPTLTQLKQEFVTLTYDDQMEVIEFLLLILHRKYRHLDQYHVPRLRAAIQLGSFALVKRELSYANETLGTQYAVGEV